MSRPSVARMEPIDRVLAPWWEPLAGLLGDLTPYDAHTHLGAADPDGYRQEADELLDALDPIGARAVTFPMHEPDGYPPANDRVLAAAAAAPDRLVAFARVDPRAAAVAEARRCLDVGARGCSLIPRAPASRQRRASATAAARGSTRANATSRSGAAAAAARTRSLAGG